jgi:hypothetical protein
MNSTQHFSITTFTDTTKKVCMCSFISMFLIILFILSPLSNLIKTSFLIKLIIIGLLIYTVYLNNLQTDILRNANLKNKTEEVMSKFNTNIICSYIFTFFLGLLTIFVIKSFF